MRWVIGIILQEHNEATTFPNNDVIKVKSGHWMSVGLCKGYDGLFLFVRNCQAVERHRRPLDILDVGDSKLCYVLEN